MKKGIYISCLAGFLIFTNTCFAENNASGTQETLKTETIVAQKIMYAFTISSSQNAKTPQEALKKNDAIFAKTKEVLKKYNLNALDQDRYSVGMSSSPQYQIQTEQDSLQFYSAINFSFENNNTNINDLVIELYSLGWMNINYERYNQ